MCGISVCLMPKFGMSVCRMSVINVFLGNDCVAALDECLLDNCLRNARVLNA